jgi:sugar phosphate isomerase/epimerase
LLPSSPQDLGEKIYAVDVAYVQIALDPIRVGDWSLEDTVSILEDLGIDIQSGMMAMAGEDYSSLESIQRTGGVRPDEHWAANLAAAGENADVARSIGIKLVTFHGGHIPARPGDPIRALMLERLRAVTDAFAQRGVRVALETGQETAETMLDVLDDLDRPTVGVNFDPANMILYGTGDPIEALEKLAPRVAQIHIKDALSSADPDQWGTEVRAASGEVDWPRFFDVIKRTKIRADLMIERESGDRRVSDIREARTLIDQFLHV